MDLKMKLEMIGFTAEKRGADVAVYRSWRQPYRRCHAECGAEWDGYLQDKTDTILSYKTEIV